MYSCLYFMLLVMWGCVFLFLLWCLLYIFDIVCLVLKFLVYSSFVGACWGCYCYVWVSLLCGEFGVCVMCVSCYLGFYWDVMRVWLWVYFVLLGGLF